MATLRTRHGMMTSFEALLDGAKGRGLRRCGSGPIPRHSSVLAHARWLHKQGLRQLVPNLRPLRRSHSVLTTEEDGGSHWGGIIASHPTLPPDVPSYAIEGGFSMINADWTVPNVATPFFFDGSAAGADMECAVWIGFGGVGGSSSSLCQAGTTSEFNGGPSFSAWIEWPSPTDFPSASGPDIDSGGTLTDFPVAAGDLFQVRIYPDFDAALSGLTSAATVLLANWTQNVYAWVYAESTFALDNSTAEWIIERPNANSDPTGSTFYPLPRFGDVYFDQAAVWVPITIPPTTTPIMTTLRVEELIRSRVTQTDNNDQPIVTALIRSEELIRGRYVYAFG
jgi:hypothetical protein